MNEACPLCYDSGYQEFSSGGIWTGENITTRREFCDCACGQDARDQIAGAGLHAARAQGIEARQGGNGEAGAVHESPTPQGDAPDTAALKATPPQGDET